LIAWRNARQHQPVSAAIVSAIRTSTTARMPMRITRSPPVRGADRLRPERALTPISKRRLTRSGPQRTHGPRNGMRSPQARRLPRRTRGTPGRALFVSAAPWQFQAQLRQGLGTFASARKTFSGFAPRSRTKPSHRSVRSSGMVSRLTLGMRAMSLTNSLVDVLDGRCLGKCGANKVHIRFELCSGPANSAMPVAGDPVPDPSEFWPIPTISA
jgi:hypothetical protein